MSASTFDLAIIGGGPAGCAAGITAASLGLRTILFESQHYPHDKLCGEFLSPECDGILDELGVRNSILKHHPHPITRAILTSPGGITWEAPLPGTAWGLSRQRFDALLSERAQQAGVVVQSGTSVDHVDGSLDTGFTLQAHTVSGRFSTNTRTVIGAYGKRSSLDRKVNRKFMQRPQPYVAFKAHFAGIPVPGQIELHTFNGGYCGLSLIEENFAQEPVTNVCFLVRTEVFHSSRQSGQKPLEAFLGWMCAQNQYLQNHLTRGHQIDKAWKSIAHVPFTPKSPVEGDLLMAGDAAGLIVPLAGDGISIALRSGMLAGSLIFRFLDENLTAAWLRQTYTHTWKQKFSRRFALGRALQSILLNPITSSTGLRLVRFFPTLGNYFVTHTREVFQPNGE